MIEIRQEAEKDYFETENVIREAFWNHYTPACNDHYLIHIMRGCPVFVPELDLVAVDGQRIVGNTMCLRSYIDGDNGKRYEVLSLGPIGVLPEYQGKGIGGMLIARTKEIAKKLGFRGILLCGDPDYYTRQGFIPAERYGIRNSENMYADALHACELYEGALSEAKGRYFEDEIYNVDEALVKEYDKLFPAKELVHGTAMQKKFEIMIEKVRPVDTQPSHLNSINQSFEQQAKKFDTTQYHLSKKEYTDYLIQAVGGTKNDSVLEVAAGTAICGRALAPFVKNVVCIDATSAMLAVGQEKALADNIDNMEFVEGLAEILPFEDASFDIVSTRLAFHHFAECEAPFREMKRVLKKGGKLVIWDMEATDESLREINDKIEKMRDFSHNRILSRKEFLNLYGKDFEMILVERKEIPVNLKGWMELTDTPMDVRGEIVQLMNKDISNEMQTGFFPYIKDGEIYFNHRWLLMIGVKK